MNEALQTSRGAATGGLLKRFGVLAGLLAVTVLAGVLGLHPLLVVTLALVQGGATLVLLLGLRRETSLVRGLTWFTAFLLVSLIALTTLAERTSQRIELAPPVDAAEVTEEASP